MPKKKQKKPNTEAQKLDRVFAEQDKLYSKIMENSSALHQTARSALAGSLKKKDILRTKRIYERNAKFHEKLLMLDVKLSHIISTKFEDQHDA